MPITVNIRNFNMYCFEESQLAAPTTHEGRFLCSTALILRLENVTIASFEIRVEAQTSRCHKVMMKYNTITIYFRQNEGGWQGKSCKCNLTMPPFELFTATKTNSNETRDWGSILLLPQSQVQGDSSFQTL